MIVRTFGVFIVLLFGKTVTEETVCQTKEGQGGICKTINNCPWAKEQLKQRKFPKVCSFEGLQPVICCLQNDADQIEPDFQLKSSGSIAAEKCLQYANSSCSVDSLPRLPITIIIGGTDAQPTEFPHMAALGYGSESDIKWECGGTLISENFILTAAHCLHSIQSGDLKYVRLGDINLAGTIGNDKFAQQFEVAEAFEYPDYKPFSHYHDIALVRLTKSVTCTQYVRPACLYFENNFPTEPLIATGWGATEYGGGNSAILQKVSLAYIPYERCEKTYRPEPKLKNGINSKWQICVGGDTVEKDTCQLAGSVRNEKRSGGPLTARSNVIISESTAVSESVEENPFTSIPHRSQQLRIVKSSLQRNLTEVLHLHAYNVQLTQALKPQDHASRLAIRKLGFGESKS